MRNGSTCGWTNCPKNVRNLVEGFTIFLKSALRDNLTGLYLHGSLAMDCFNPASSDVDLLVIIRDKLSLEQKRRTIGHILADNLAARLIEMTIVLEKDLKTLVYPPPFELHYSHTWYDRFKNNQVDFTQQRYDEDLPAHFLSTRQRGIHLFGKPIEEIFSEMPHQLYVKSLAQDEQWLFDSPLRNPEDTVLNPCRFLAFLTEGSVFSKKEGGEWALLTLPKEFHPLIKSALMIYAGKETSSVIDSYMLSGFIEYAKNRGNALIESTGG